MEFWKETPSVRVHNRPGGKDSVSACFGGYTEPEAPKPAAAAAPAPAPTSEKATMEKAAALLAAGPPSPARRAVSSGTSAVMASDGSGQTVRGTSVRVHHPPGGASSGLW